MEAVKNLNRLVDYYHENKLSHAYLIETNNLSKCFADLKSVIKAINCSSKYEDGCAKCNLCNLLDNNYLPSFIVIEADGKNIKKEQILELKSRFSSLPTFTKENIYIIKEAEKLNSSSANTMLKFLEEPEDHIIGFFLTNDSNNVINTIKSRCEILKVRYDEDESNDVFLNSYFDVVYNYLQKIESEKKDVIIHNKKWLLSEYSDREDIKQVFLLIQKIYQEGIKEKKNPTNGEFIEKFPFIVNQKMHELIEKEKIIVKYIEDLSYNVNIELFVDKFVIELSGLNG